ARHLHAVGHSCRNVFLAHRALRLVLARQRTQIHHRSGETEATNIRRANESRRASMNTAVIVVSELPAAVEDHTSPIWWGNLFMLFIETTMFALLVGSYFYLRMNFTHWPPVRSDVGLYHTIPDFGFATGNLLVLIAICVPRFIVNRACLRMDLRSVRIGMAIMVLIG